MKTFLSLLVLVLLIGGGAWLWLQGSSKLINKVVYACDNGKTISAAYYEGPAAPTPSPGEPPTPTGSVEVSLDNGPVMTLNQTLSASGVRYANSDESFVFWNKGNEALIMRDNVMDLAYTNCVEE